MDVHGARLILDVSQTLITVLVAIYVWWTGRSRATTKAIQAVDRRVDDVDRHLKRLEQTLENRPAYRDLDQLRSEVVKTNRVLAGITAQLQGTTALLNRLHEYLLHEKKETS